MTSEVQLRPSAGEHSVPEHDAAGRLCGDLLRPDCGCVWSTRPVAQAQSTDVYNDDDEDDEDDDDGDLFDLFDVVGGAVHTAMSHAG